MQNEKISMTAETNITHLDIIGRLLTEAVSSGRGLTPEQCSLLVMAVADCRVYSTVRDQETLTDETSKILLAELNSASSEPSAESDQDGAANEIAASITEDLRKSGIDI